jgi:hypothetical protein
MRATLVGIVALGLMLGSALWAAVADMFKDEVRTRLGRLPYVLIRLAALRLPRANRADVVEEWDAELNFVLHGTEALPLTRLLRGFWFSADLMMRGAPAVAREIKVAVGIRDSPRAFRTRLTRLPSWASLFPEGRDIFYEGDDPAGFASQIETEFGFRPTLDPRWGVLIKTDSLSFTSYCFYCPARHLDAIYGSDRFEVGS